MPGAVATKGMLVAGGGAADIVVGAALCIMGTTLEAGAMHSIGPVGINCGGGCGCGCGIGMLGRACWQWNTLGLKTGGAQLTFSSADLFGIS